MYHYDDIDKLEGCTLQDVRLGPNREWLEFCVNDGRVMRMWHEENCCESVTLEDINGDVEDLIGEPILFAEERILDDEMPMDITVSDAAYHEEESYTWTFYRIGTIKGTVVLRWYGSSNGYYSESVDCAWFKEDDDE